MRKEAKDHARNRLMDFYIRKAPTYATIVKIEHFPNDTTPNETTDLQPLVVYSLNKKKRWEIEENLLESFSDDDVKSIVVEREIPDLYYAWWSIGNVHSHDNVNLSKPVSSTQVENAKKEKKVVGYHIVRIPKNYKKVFDNKCFRYIGLRYPEFLGYSHSDILSPLEYELRENEGEDDLADETVETQNEMTTEPNGFYNLEEHFVAKQPRKPKGWLTV